MRIAISTVMDSAKSGAWQVIKNIIFELKNIDKSNQYIIFVEKTYNGGFGVLPENFTLIKAPITAKQPILNIIWHGFILPLLLIRYRIDILHLPWHSVAFFIKTRPTVLTIPDLTEYELSGHYSKSRVIYRKMMLLVSPRLADRIITVSKYSKKKIINFLKIPPQKISVVYHAANPRYVILDKQNARKHIKNIYKVDFPFILYVGQIQHPNKNLVRLINAFNILKADCAIAHRLVLVGKKHHTGDIVYETVDKLGLKQDVIFTGYIPDEDLPYFYNAASLFVYPSLYEGFGLPVLEAMACGCLVVSSDIEIFREITGDAVILVSPKNVNGIAEAMADALIYPVKRDKMIQDGLFQAGRYSWRKSSEQILSLYKAVKK